MWQVVGVAMAMHSIGRFLFLYAGNISIFWETVSTIKLFSNFINYVLRFATPPTVPDVQ